MAEKLILVDGTALAYRSFYAFIRRPLRSSRGENTSTSFGFINSILKLRRQYKPDYLIVSFDLGAPTVRHEIFPDYKSTRAKMPEEMVDTLPRLDQVVEALNLPVIKIEGIEADDIIGTLAVKGARQGLDVFIYTGDKDFFQLVNDRISVILPGKKGEDDTILDPKGVREKFGVEPGKVIDVLALMGDSSDNIPGVPGVGPKTAISLVSRYGGFDELYESTGKVSSERTRKSLIEFKDQAGLSKRLVTIDTDIDIDIDWEKFKLSDPDTGKILPLLKELEFNRLVEEFAEPAAGTGVRDKADYKKVGSIDELKALAGKIKETGYVAIDTETTSLQSRKAELVGISISMESRTAAYIPVGHEDSNENLPLDRTLDIIKSICHDESILKVGQNLKYDMQVFKNYGVDFKGRIFDTMLASYVLDPSSRQHGLSALAMKYFDYKMQPITDLIGTGKKQKSFATVSVGDAVFYAGEDADITFRIFRILQPRLKEAGLEKLYYEMEIPLIEVLRVMEEVGVRVNRDKLREISNNMSGQLQSLTEKIYKIAGCEFNINSPVQLQKVLFEDLQLPTKGKTAGKTGYSTDSSVLEELAEIHELPRLILDYRELTKVKSTYSDALVELIDPGTSRIHTSFNQAVTATGRLSSSDPNLQNIPVRTELGREVREAFVPADDDHIFLSADYSQVELRLMAHIAGDETMIRSFINDEDIHRRTAAEVYGVKIDDVTPEMRRRAKVANFAVIYGVSAYGLSRQVEMTVKESAKFIDIYFERYPGVKKFMEEIVRKAEEQGYVSTIFGRRRYIPDIKAKNRQVREFAKRAAINTPIQGSAADIIKLAMIKIHNDFIEHQLKSKMVLQVHDELLFDVFNPELETVKAIVKEGMENVVELKIPLKADIGTGNNWLEAH
jgi:DNA polymerase-1